MAMSVKELKVLVFIQTTLRFWDDMVNFHHIVFTEEQSALGAFPFLLFQEFCNAA